MPGWSLRVGLAAALLAAAIGCNAIPINIPDPKAADAGFSPDAGTAPRADMSAADGTIGNQPDMHYVPPPPPDAGWGSDASTSLLDAGSADGAICIDDGFCPPPTDGGPTEGGVVTEAGQPLDVGPLPSEAGPVIEGGNPGLDL